MTAYYNEFDPFAAQWLRNLIKERLIATGIVDDRSILEVAPSDLADLRRCMMLVDEIPEIKDSFPLIAKKVKRFSPILREWDSLIALLKLELKRPDKRAPKTYKWIKELLSDQD
ncbi:hypothetical protein QE86_004301 [Salmonella enterica subsp. enterica]|nr:hypothetical protein [Salmonella enterica subsp. enterica serovar Saintpaul]EBX4769850.1 hypothetical protein [Salmonella enterica subsp. enterica serovar Saintpaul]EDT2853240.1 hypothetical protein [Salmonella enterica subsp. enterica serovar Stanleyville]